LVEIVDLDENASEVASVIQEPCKSGFRPHMKYYWWWN
jgi:hypothetical protein